RCHHQDRIIAGDRMARIAEHGEAVGGDPTIRRKGGDHVDLAARQRPVHEGRAVRRRRGKAQRVGAPHRRPLRPFEEFEIAAEPQPR
nr:hypothetical protein [Tanacetum cinerariifolium]